jgi:hypothetical protein
MKRFEISMAVNMVVWAEDADQASSEAEGVVLNINDRVSADLSVETVEVVSVEEKEEPAEDDGELKAGHAWGPPSDEAELTERRELLPEVGNVIDGEIIGDEELPQAARKMWA